MSTRYDNGGGDQNNKNHQRFVYGNMELHAECYPHVFKIQETPSLEEAWACTYFSICPFLFVPVYECLTG